MGRLTQKPQKSGRGRHCNSVVSILAIVYLLAIIALIVRLFFVQIIDLPRYKEWGRRQRASHNFSIRGDIYDRNGIKLATDRIYYNIYARREDYTSKETPEKIAKLFAPVLHMPEKTLYNKLTRKFPVI